MTRLLVVWILTSWQLWPAYLLLAAALFRRRRMVLGALLAVTIGVWTILPVPWLDEPDGPYAVGTRTYRWVDPSRPELATDDPHDQRNVIAQIFYPAPKGATGEHSLYLDGLSQLPPYVSILPRFLLMNFGHTDTHAIVNAPLAPDTWPLIVFSPGYGAPRGFYTSLITGLASRGNIVLAIDHPYEAAVTELADGRIVSTIIRPPPHDPDLLAYMAIQQDLRVADIKFALDQFAHLPFRTRSISAVGHSFGGAASVDALQQDSRISAAVNIDGTPYGPPRQWRGRVLLLQSDPALGQHGAAFVNGNLPISNRYTFKDTNHYAFTDLPLMFSPPGRWLLSIALGGAPNVRHVHRETLDRVTAFLQ